MNGLTLVAVLSEEGTGSHFLATDDGQFSVSASLRRDIDEAEYVHLRAALQAPDAVEGFGFFHVVVDAEGALLQMAVGETDEDAASRVLERLCENDIDLKNRRSEELTAKTAAARSASVLGVDGARVTLRAKAYRNSDPLGESLLCLRLLLEPFGAVQIVISDCGRLLAIATGRRDREAYQRVRHELIRRGFALDDPNARPESGSL